MAWWDDAIGWVDNNIIDPIVDTSKDLWKDTTKAATDAWNYAVSLVNQTGEITKHVANTVAKQTEEAAKQGVDVASDSWKQGSESAIAAYRTGAEAVQKAAEDAYAWLEANACYLGLNTAITIGVVAYFTPKSAGDPGTTNSTAVSGAWVTAKTAGKMKTTAEKMAVACTMAGIINEGFHQIPGVKGQVSKTLSYNVLANSIYSTIDNAYLWGTPALVGIAVGSALAPIMATLICEGIVPKNSSKPPPPPPAENVNPKPNPGKPGGQKPGPKL